LFTSRGYLKNKTLFIEKHTKMIQKKQNFLSFLKSNSDPPKNFLSLSKDNETTSGPAKLGLNNDYDKNQKRFSRLTFDVCKGGT
jgi:hypothetical protein